MDTANACNSCTPSVHAEKTLIFLPLTFRPIAAAASRIEARLLSPKPTRKILSVSESVALTGISNSSPAFPEGEKNESSSRRRSSKCFSIAETSLDGPSMTNSLFSFFE